LLLDEEIDYGVNQVASNGATDAAIFQNQSIFNG
jgi:hypothetical protein